MSSMLNEAIVDAKALRESALKNAESSVINKYSEEVKKVLEQLLEQDELDLGSAPLEEEEEGTEEEIVENENDVPYSATDDFSMNDGKNLSSLPNTGDNVEVTIDLGSLQEAVKSLATSLEEDDELEINEEELAEILSEDEEELEEAAMENPDPSAQKTKAEEDEFEGSQEGGLGESIDTDSLVDAIIEKLTVDMGAELSGWAGRPTSELQYEQERELAAEAADDEEDLDENDDEETGVNESLVEIQNENKNLKQQLNNIEQAFNQMKENLYEVNLSNARLLYTNRVLRNSSLNERQKDKIVEAISGAGSVTEAKTIFETLQSTVEAKPRRSPKSLSEAISSKSSVIRATRNESQQPKNDAFSDRMRRLAGIK
jgi:hypothetical protein